MVDEWKIWNTIKWSWQEKTEVRGEKPAPVPLCLPHPTWRTLGSNPHKNQWVHSGLCNDRSVTILQYTISGTTVKWCVVPPCKLSLQILTNEWRWEVFKVTTPIPNSAKLSGFTSLTLNKLQQYYDFWRKKMFEQNHVTQLLYQLLHIYKIL